MTQVDFYLLNSHEPETKLRFLCRLASKIYHMGKSVYVQARDDAQAQRLDDLMWTFDQSSFVPHGRTGSKPAEVPFPVLIGSTPPCDEGRNVLISLLDEVPEYFEQFERVAELVDDSPADMAGARERFRQYRARGCRLETHEINT